MGEKEPILTRSKIREMKKEEERTLSRLTKLDKERLEALREKDRSQKTPSDLTPPTEGGRLARNQKINERSSFLTKAIIIVTILLIIMGIIIFRL